MSELKNLLQDAIEHSDTAGGVLSVNAITRLERYRERQFKIFVIIELLVVFAVAGCAWYLVTHPAQTVGAKALAGLVGVGSGGGFEVARRVWKEWARTDLLVLLMSEATEGQVKSLIDRLLKAL